MARALPLSMLLVLPAVSLCACNRYEMFRVTGFEQVGFSNDADILFLVDNSDSMQDEAQALALNFQTFITKLTSIEEELPRATLTDAVSNYLGETSLTNIPIDYQLAVTTTTVAYAEGGESNELEPGEAGLFAGDPTVITRGDADGAQMFQANLLCDVTCWNELDVPTDPSYVCTGDGYPELAEGEEVSQQYLDCLCGAGEWQNHCGAGNEEGLEAALLALCRASDNPPSDCYEHDDLGIPFEEGDEGTNPGFLRPDATTVVVIVTDEGDGSRRMTTGDVDIEPYLDIFAQFANPVRFAVIGPPYHDGDFSCNSGGAQPWAVERYQAAVGETGGVYIDIETDASGDCATTDFAVAMEQIGDLLNQLQTIFPLQTIPDISTIEVYIDGAQISESILTEGSIEAGTAEWSDGWTYDAAYNAVIFHGQSIPSFNADVRIYYRPLGGMPRELPF